MAFNGAKAAELYRRLVQPSLAGAPGGLPQLVLPSTSPAHAGRSLDELSPEILREVRIACLRHDPDGVRLIEAYFDRRFPGWREHAQADRDAGGGTDPKSGPMTKEEAYEILGLQPGAEADAIRRAHRGLIKRLHPDQGGSTYLAGRVNQAKDVLLNRHR